MKAKIVSNTSEHEFKNGTIVVCEGFVEEDGSLCWHCQDVDDSTWSWWVDPIDLEIIEE
jgi:hypothetical protein